MLTNNLGLIVEVYRGARFGDSTNGGLSGRFSEITVVNLTEILGYGCDIFEVKRDRPAFKLVKGALRSIILQPVDQPSGVAGPMFGGNYGASSDGRFGEACRKLLGHDFYGAVPIHDRFETWELNEMLSR